MTARILRHAHDTHDLPVVRLSWLAAQPAGMKGHDGSGVIVRIMSNHILVFLPILSFVNLS
jgi:hypothetical protein